MIRVAYVAGASHSGSTLLQLVLEMLASLPCILGKVFGGVLCLFRGTRGQLVGGFGSALCVLSRVLGQRPRLRLARGHRHRSGQRLCVLTPQLGQLRLVRDLKLGQLRLVRDLLLSSCGSTPLSIIAFRRRTR